jgi:hypothetical protein
MTTYNIDDNVPMRSPHRSKYPLAVMEIGQSFFVPGKNINGMTSIVAYAQKATGRRFSCRARVEKGLTGVRVWRVA